MIQTQNLTFSYIKNQPFSFPNIVCPASETLLITGGSGKGKTTLLHLLGGLLKPTSGNITINETEINGLSNSKLDAFRGKNIGFVLQQNYFVSSLSVLDNIVMASWFSNQKKEIEKAKKLLEMLDLSSQMHKLPSQLSVGQQQRVSIARALINEPKVVLADEPTSSLDDENALKVADLLSNLASSYKAALIIVTHDQRLKDQFKNQISL
ncbi:MAG: ABC transporter ATP-binding protein [Flavobacterium sp.]